MKNLTMFLAFATAAGAAQALPVLGPATVTTNLAVGFLVGPPDGNGRLASGYNPLGGQIVGGPNPRNIDGSCSESFVSCFGRAHSYVTAVPAPSADATATYSLNGTMPANVTLPLNPQVGASTTTTLQYQFSANGPSGTTAYVDLESFMSASGVYAPGLVVASLGGFRIYGSDGDVWVSTYLYGGTANPTLQRYTRDLNGNLTYTSVPSPGSGRYFENEVVPFAANTAYTIRLYATAFAGQLIVNGGNAGGGSAEGYVDPQFTIDPMTPNASAYSLAFSDGIGNPSSVPEPATVWMVAIGLGCLTWRLAAPAARRSRRPPGSPHVL